MVKCFLIHFSVHSKKHIYVIWTVCPLKLCYCIVRKQILFVKKSDYMFELLTFFFWNTFYFFFLKKRLIKIFCLQNKYVFLCHRATKF